MKRFPGGFTEMTSARCLQCCGTVSEVWRTGGARGNGKPWSFRVVTDFPYLVGQLTTVSRTRSSIRQVGAGKKAGYTQRSLGIEIEYNRPSMSPVIATSAATLCAGKPPAPCSDSRRTRETAGPGQDGVRRVDERWITPFFINQAPAPAALARFVLASTTVITYTEVRLDWLLHKVTSSRCSRPRCSPDNHGRHQSDAGLRMLSHQSLGRLDSFHLWHGDGPWHDVRWCGRIR